MECTRIFRVTFDDIYMGYCVLGLAPRAMTYHNRAHYAPNRGMIYPKHGLGYTRNMGLVMSLTYKGNVLSLSVDRSDD